MDYIALSQLYYSDRKAYDALLQQRLSGETTIHLDFQVSGNPAFFVKTPELLEAVLRIERADKNVRSIVLPGVAQEQFISKCLIDEVVVTNSIEGVHSTRREISDILSKLETDDKRRKFKGIVRKYYMLTKEDSVSLNTCEDIRAIYDELVLHEISEANAKDTPDGKLFRKDSVSVYSETQKEIHRGVYPEQEIIDAMNRALAILNTKEIDILFRIALFHYFFGYIHPFYDGNGRTSRFISSYLLSRELHPILGYRISFTVKEKIRRYYEAFKICNDPNNKGDLTPFLLMFMDIVEKSIEQLEKALRGRLEKLESYADKISRLPKIVDKSGFNYKIYDVLVLAGLFAEAGISTTDMLNYLEVSRSTLRRYLKCTASHNLLVVKTVGHVKYYSLDLRQLDEM
ncbi:MAG: Fic family protein [Oscillospiraceae bacterium]|nr:Fic family protein [Oscillospiraceae bacterium]